jgi:hypothetical protein
MNVALFVAKADGNREVLDNVSVEVAREAFERMDWDSELAFARAEGEAGREMYIPEFGLADAAERTLVISPVDSNTVTFYFQYPDRVSAVPSLPKGEVAGLVGLYFAGEDDAIAAIVAKNTPAGEILLRELSDSEFRATIAPPMRCLGATENCRQVHLREYLGACISALSLPASLDTLEIADIYAAADKLHSHILFNYGDPGTALAIVVRHDPDTGDSVLGHHFVNAAGSYYTGCTDGPVKFAVGNGGKSPARTIRN